MTYKIDVDGDIIVLTYPEIATLELVDEFLDAIDVVSEKMPGNFAILADLRPLDTRTTTSPIREHFFARNEEFDKGPHGKQLTAEAIILDSRALRALVSTYFWFKGDRKWYTSKVFANLDDGRRFCLEKLAERNARSGAGEP